MPSQDTWTTISSLKQGAYNSRRRTWVVTPHFGSLPSDSKPVNPYTDDRTMYSQVPREVSGYTDAGGFHQVSPAGYLYTGAQIEGALSSFWNSTTFTSDLGNVDNAVAVKLLGKISDMKVNLAVSLFEAEKTVDLLLGTAKRIYSAYRHFRHGNLKGVAKDLGINLQTVHKTWLEYKYGWMPLLMDVKGAAEALAQQHVGRPPRFTAVASESRSFHYERITSYAAYGGGSPAYYTESIRIDYGQKQKAWVELIEPHASFMQQLGLTNPALLAWELIPFSFVFDWFISVGDYLQGLTALQGVSVRRAMRDNYVAVVYDYNQPSTTRVSGGTVYSNAAFIFSAPKRQYARSSMILDPYSVYPPGGRGLDLSKCITSLALMRGNVRNL